MTNEELAEKMLAFIATKDSSYDDEWYASPYDFAAVTLSDFAEYLGFALEVPPYMRHKDKTEIDRDELFKQLLPHINDLFDLHFKELSKK